jgi:hypothetical protein
MTGGRRTVLDPSADPDWLLGGDRFFDTSAGGLDVWVDPPGAAPFAELQSRAARYELQDGLKVTVVAREDLDSMKRATGRKKDLQDLAELEDFDEHRDPDVG